MKKQATTSAHVLLAMYQEDREVAQYLERVGVTEQRLLEELSRGAEESASALEVCFERAEKNGPAATHLLASFLREPRCAAYRMLDRMSVPQGSVLPSAGPASSVSTNKRPSSPPPLLPARETTARETTARETTARETTARETTARETSSSRTSLLNKTKAIDLKPTVARSTPPLSINPLAPTANRTSSKQEASVQKASSSDRPSSPSAKNPTLRSSSTGSKPLSSSPVAPVSVLDKETHPTLLAVASEMALSLARDEAGMFYGRDAEIERALDALNCKQNSSVLFAGGDGVGKTTVLRQCARVVLQTKRTQTQTGNLAKALWLETSLPRLLAGTGVRGALADRMNKLRQELASFEDGAVLCIDGLSNLLSNEGGDEMATELRACLQAGLRIVATSSEREVKKMRDKQSTLLRNFTEIELVPMNAADTIAAAKLHAISLANHHQIRFEPGTIELAVEATSRFLPEKNQPEKTLSVLDRAAARAKRKGETTVDRAAVASIVGEASGVPAGRIESSDGERMLSLGAELKERIIGQDQNLDRIAQAILRSAAGFRGKRPLATFLFLGSTGVGKTETAKAIADVLFGDRGMSRFDMSEFSEAHATSKLLGAPPGYIGHEDGGVLTECVRTKPYQLLLLDEIEKAHPDVLLALLPLLDEGRLTDARGRTIDFSNTIVVLTSNLGASSLFPKARVGFGDGVPSMSSLSQNALQAARKAMPPELWNRIDETLAFLPLREEHGEQIAHRFLLQAQAQLRTAHQIELAWTPEIAHWLVRHGGFDQELGARPMRRLVAREVEGRLAEAILRQSFHGKKVLEIHVGDHGLTVVPGN